jgi:GDP-L-fucose synthase
MTKRMLLCGLISLNKQYGLKYLYLIPSTLYGPDYHLDGRQMHFIFDLIRKILQGKLYDQEVVLWGDGHQKRELVHIEDFISALFSLVKTQENTWINIGAGEEFSIRDLAEKICLNVDFPKEKIQYDLTKYVGARSKILSIKKLQQLLPNFQPTSLDAGLKGTINWFLQNKEKF